MQFNRIGKGGKTMAGALGAAGRKVALIERSSMMYMAAHVLTWDVF